MEKRVGNEFFLRLNLLECGFDYEFEIWVRLGVVGRFTPCLMGIVNKVSYMKRISFIFK
jgi:hypothetical protein